MHLIFAKIWLKIYSFNVKQQPLTLKEKGRQKQLITPLSAIYDVRGRVEYLTYSTYPVDIASRGIQQSRETVHYLYTL